MENIKHWIDIIVGITILYTSLVEVFLKHSLMDDPDTGNIATSFFKKKIHRSKNAGKIRLISSNFKPRLMDGVFLRPKKKSQL